MGKKCKTGAKSMTFVSGTFLSTGWVTVCTTAEPRANFHMENSPRGSASTKGAIKEAQHTMH